MDGARDVRVGEAEDKPKMSKLQGERAKSGLAIEKIGFRNG